MQAAIPADAIPLAHASRVLLTIDQLIDRIKTFNPSASPDYLASFDRAALINYLEHLEYAHCPRGPHARWERRPETPAIIYAEPPAAA